MSNSKLLNSARTQSARLTVLADHAVSSGTNFVSLALVAATSRSDEFGALALGALAFTTMIALVRAGLGEVALLGDLTRTETQQAAWGAGLAGAALLGAIALPLGGDLRTAMLLTAIALPAGLAQDVARWTEIRAGEPSRALRSDIIWLVSLAVAAAGLFIADAATGPRLYAAWVLAIYVSTLAFPGLPTAWRHALSGIAALRSVRTTAIDSIAQASITNFSNLALFALLGVTTSLDVVGAVRGAWLLFGPTHVLTAALAVSAVAAMSRRPSLGEQRRVAMTATIIATIGVIAWGSLMLALPDSIGARLLSDTWEPTSALRLEAFALFLAVAIGSGASFLLRARRQHRAMSTIYLGLIPLTLGLPLAGSLRSNGTGFLLGSTAATVIASFALIRRASRPESAT